MKTAGIIAEYNPFHNGHALQYRILKEEYGYDHILVAMSGDFTQRGAPAILDKYQRARMALLSGADLVFELPALWSSSSAEFFAAAGILLLKNTGITDAVCFGCETPDPMLLTWTAQSLLAETGSFKEHLNSHLKSGISFPTARMLALCEEPDLPCDRDSLSAFLSSPNNILAIEYEKARLKYAPELEMLPVRRSGSEFHSGKLEGTICSATAFREALRKPDISGLSHFTTEPVFSLIRDAAAGGQLLDTDDFSAMLMYRLLSMEDFSAFADCSDAFSHKLLKSRRNCLTVTDLVTRLKSKDLTYTRISRALFHILLGHTKKMTASLQGDNAVPYLRVLGFRESAGALLSEMKHSATVPVITKPADAKKLLAETGQAPTNTGVLPTEASFKNVGTPPADDNSPALSLFKADIHAHDIYGLALSQKTKMPSVNDYQHRLEIIP